MPVTKTLVQRMDDALSAADALPEKPRLLLHACCGPCSSAVLEQLAAHFAVTVLYYNPNTWPPREYRRRGDELRRFVAAAYGLGLAVVEEPYDPAEFYEAVRGLENEPERGARCTLCYRLRLERTARLARESGFDWFATTLSVSPHKDATRLDAIGQELAAQYGVRYLPADFKKRNGYLRSLQLSAEYGLYRQEYCGCEFSAAARGITREQAEMEETASLQSGQAAPPDSERK